MPKHIIEFNLPEEQEELESAMNGWRAEVKLENIWQKTFRPRHKHGYSNDRINKLLENSDCNELMDLLEELYREALEDV